MPGVLRITEVDLDVGRQCEALVVGHLFTPIPSQRLVEFLRQLASVFDQRVYDRTGIFSGDLYQHHVAGMTFDEGRNLAAIGSSQQVTFPVTG